MRIHDRKQENHDVDEWSNEDAVFIGYCPQFFPYGAVCHGHTEARAIAKLAAIVRDELGEQTLRRTRPRGRTFNTHVFGKPVGFEDLQLPQHSSNQTLCFECIIIGNNCFHSAGRLFPFRNVKSLMLTGVRFSDP
jgi:hypothetical protein